MSAILYERQIELAYEGKRFDDLRRWMLFDGGQNKVEGAPNTWTLTGWDGNTCTYLGFTEFNGQRRDNLEFRVSDKYNNGLGDKSWGMGENDPNPDPLYTAMGEDDYKNRPVIDLREELASQQEALKAFYSTYLMRKKKKGDAYIAGTAQSEKHMKFYPKYYFLGLYQGAQSNNPTLKQTIGWGDYMNGGSNGTFDPLAE